MKCVWMYKSTNDIWELLHGWKCSTNNMFNMGLFLTPNYYLTSEDLGPDLLTACASANPLFLRCAVKKLNWKGVGTLIFAADLIAYAFVECPFQMQNLWEESIFKNHATWFTMVNLLVFAPLFRLFFIALLHWLALFSYSGSWNNKHVSYGWMLWCFYVIF